MTTTRVYRSTDSGAPTMARNTAGSALAVIRACLVDGYGSKTPAGWTEEYTGTNKAAFRNSLAAGGLGCYVRVADTDTSNSYRPMSLRTYRTMSDVDTGDDPTHEVIVNRSPSAFNNPISWIVVADERTFYIGISELASGGVSHMDCGGAGDFESLQAGDSYAYFALGGQWDMSGPPTWSMCDTTGGGFGDTTDATQLSVGRDWNGLGTAVYYGLLRPALGGSSNQALGGQNFPARPSVNSADEAALPAYMARALHIRGRLRGIYLPLSNLQSMAQGEAKVGDGFGGAGSVCAALRQIGYIANTGCGLWVETALPWS
jgi:hypothetical protein